MNYENHHGPTSAVVLCLSKKHEMNEKEINEMNELLFTDANSCFVFCMRRSLPQMRKLICGLLAMLGWVF